jgi:adenylate cyclase class 2
MICTPIPAASSEEPFVIEAELKARLADPAGVRAALARRATPERAIYRDVYYDTAAEDLDHTGRELRLRKVETDVVRHLLTFKEPAVDASGSKPEYETTVGDAAAVDHLVRALGLRTLVELTKECENYRFTVGGRQFLATIVRVPELGDTFLEVETMAAEADVDHALSDVRGVLAELGVRDEELTGELYTDAVRAARSAG